MTKSITSLRFNRNLVSKIRNSLDKIKGRVDPYLPHRPAKLSSPSLGSHLVASLGWGLFASFIFHFIWQCNLQLHQFGHSLTADQKKTFHKICRHRAWITLWGLVIAFFPAIILAHGCGVSIGHFLFFWLLLTGIIYGIWPKKDYMLNHIETPAQASQWYAVYLCMKHVCLTGFIVGFLVSILLAYFAYPTGQQSICNVIL